MPEQYPECLLIDYPHAVELRGIVCLALSWILVADLALPWLLADPPSDPVSAYEWQRAWNNAYSLESLQQLATW